MDEHEPDSLALPDRDRPNVIPCHCWDLTTVDPVRLRPIPHQLPDLPDTGLSDQENSKETKLIKIASLDNRLIGLTNKGHVLKYDRLTDEETYDQGRWEYVCTSHDIPIYPTDEYLLAASLL